MGKKRSRNPPNNNLSRTNDEERQTNGTILILGAFLAVFLAVLVSQLRDVFFAYKDMLKSQESSPSSNTVEHRKIARITISSNFIIEEEIKAFVDRNEPFVCRGCLNLLELPFWKNDNRLLETVGLEASIQVRTAQRSDNTLFRRITNSSSKVSAYEERSMLFSDFLQHYNDGEAAHLYGAQIPVLDKLPQLLGPIQKLAPPTALLEALGPTPLRSHRPLSLYIGYGPLVTQTHYDSMENLVCVASGGYKTFHLYDPASASLYMYINRKRDGNTAPVFDEFEPGNKRHPFLKYAIPSSVTMTPGDCLYVPVYWYHSVSSSAGRTVSINWWRMPKHEKMLDLERLFCGFGEANVEAARAKCH